MTDADHISVDLTTALIRDHAREQMALRQVTEEQVRAVLAQPDEVLPVRTGRVVAQRMMMVKPGVADQEKAYLFRVFVDIDRRPPEMVTVYRTSRIRKYRSAP